MKRKLLQSLSLLLCLIMLLSTTPVFAAEEAVMYDLSQTNQADEADDEITPITGYLPEPGDTIEYTFSIDHSVYPEFVLYAFTQFFTGDTRLMVYDESGKWVRGVELTNIAKEDKFDGIYSPKDFTQIKNTSGEEVNYTLVASTTTGNAGYSFYLGTIDDFIPLYGGDNFATVEKNIPPQDVAEIGMTRHFKGSQMLLNTGEWFHYVADGYTYITAEISKHDTLSFAVIDADTLDIVYVTNEKDRGIKQESETLYSGYVQQGLNLEAGKSYLIKFFTTSPITPKSVTDYYNIYIGLPATTSEKISYKSPSSYSVPAYTTRTFTFNVSGLPDTGRLYSSTVVGFTTSSSLDNSYITNCTITAPNGYTFPTVHGSKTSFAEVDVTDYFGNPNNTPLNGKWTVTITSSKSLSGLTFKIGGWARTILGERRK